MKKLISPIHSTKNNKIFCLIGPSGTGKSALADKIPLPEVVSYKTRAIRKGEVEGVNGHFISKEEFLKMDELDLWIAKTEYSHNFYGITQGELLELENTPMLYVIDWEGVKALRKEISKIRGYSEDQIVTIFIHTPRYDLEARMRYQREESEEVIRARLDRADRDYAASHKCDYVVENVNGELDKTAYEVMEIILKESFTM